MRINILVILLAISFHNCQLSKKTGNNKPNNPTVITVGAMKDAMWKGELFPKIMMDSISPNKGLYGLGPMSYMRGEILINNGHIYTAYIENDSVLQVVETDTISAPFFVFGHNNNWQTIGLPKSVLDLSSFEAYMDKNVQTKNPFVFKLEGTIKLAKIHVQNLPEDTVVTSPADAHIGQQQFEIENKTVQIIGFYSKHHKGIFTHHDTHMHMHLITEDLNIMGHLDDFIVDQITLSLPRHISFKI